MSVSLLTHALDHRAEESPPCIGCGQPLALYSGTNGWCLVCTSPGMRERLVDVLERSRRSNGRGWAKHQELAA
jgi:hypothetical protein